jgi:hypothetical protein
VAIDIAPKLSDDSGSMFSQAAVQACVALGRRELILRPAIRCFAFVDMSDGQGDSAVVAVAHFGKNDKVIVDVIREYPAPHSPEKITAEICALLKMYRCYEVEGDRFAANWCSDAFEKNKIRYRQSELNRSELYLELLPIVMGGQLELLDNPKLIGQLCGLERKVGRGRDNVDHAPGGRDDVCNACAGAIIRVFKSNGGVLGFVEYLKEIHSGKIQDPTVTPPPVSFDELRTVDCAHCESDLMIRTGNVWHGNACALDTTTTGQPIPPPAATEPCGCGLPLVLIPGGKLCNQCGMQFAVGVQSKDGITRKEFDKRNPRDFKSVFSYPQFIKEAL